MSIIERAILVATNAHSKQVRKYTNEPYITHPMAVAGLVASVNPATHVIAAAILHDVVEDTSVSIEDIRLMFGDRVAELVDDLTDVSKPEDGNRGTRKAIDRLHTANISPTAMTIKLADLIDNTKTICCFDFKFSKLYLEEKRLLLRVLGEGDKTLFKLAKEIVELNYPQEELK